MFRSTSVTPLPDSLTRNGRPVGPRRNSLPCNNFSDIRQTCLRGVRLSGSVSLTLPVSPDTGFRRDKIVAFFDKEIAAKGEAAVLFELPRSGQPCGVGL